MLSHSSSMHAQLSSVDKGLDLDMSYEVSGKTTQKQRLAQASSARQYDK